MHLTKALLDYGNIDPNPCRDRTVRLPRVEDEIPTPPTASQVAALISALPERWRLPCRIMEQTGMRVGEVCALFWGDVDARGSRFRVRTGKTRAARRWVKVPEWLMAAVEKLCPREDRTPERRVFVGAKVGALQTAMRRACTATGLPNITPHDFRHRYISVQIARGVPVTEVAAQVGHARKSVTHDTYSHVLLEENERNEVSE
jgi:integrase